MKEMAAMQSGMSFYGDLPDSYSVILNTEHPLIKRVMDDAKAALNDKVVPMEESIDSINKTVAELRDKKDATEAEKLQITENEAKAESIRKEENEVIRTYAASNPLIKQLIDLALLGNNLLKGQALDEFLKRSVELLK